MTIQKTIQMLERMLYPEPWEDFELSDKAKEALETAIEALEKQIPKNPVINGDKNEFWTEDALLCPDCKQYFGGVYNEGYCRTCGRKLVQKRIRVLTEGEG